MKAHLITLIFFGYSMCLMAQTFETPQNWASSNRYSIGNGAGVTVTRSSISHSGVSAARLEGKYSGALVRNIPGMITTGVLSGINASGGKPYSLRSQKLIGYAMYSPVGADKASIEVLLSRYNASTHKRDTIAYGNTILNNTSSYTFFEVDLKYKNTMDAPDSQIVVVSSSENKSNPVAGSILFLDDVSFSGTNLTTGTSLLSLPSLTLIYHNPASGSFTIRPREPIQKFSIINFIGEEVYRSNTIYSGQDIKITNGLPEGFYLIQIHYLSGSAEVIKFVSIE